MEHDHGHHNYSWVRLRRRPMMAGLLVAVTVTTGAAASTTPEQAAGLTPVALNMTAGDAQPGQHGYGSCVTARLHPVRLEPTVAGRRGADLPRPQRFSAALIVGGLERVKDDLPLAVRYPVAARLIDTRDERHGR